MHDGDGGATTPRGSGWWGTWDLLAVALVTIAVHAGIRNFSMLDLDHELNALDLGVLSNEIALVHAGTGAPYSDIRVEYGPYWLGFFLVVVRALGTSLGAIQAGIAAAGWVRSFATYALTSRLVGRRWGLLALACTLVSPAVVYPIPWASQLVSPLYVLLTCALVATARPGASPRWWVIVGLLIGVLIGVRSYSGTLGLAAAGIVAAATGRLHLPLRRGHVVGTWIVPAALVASVGILCWNRPPSLAVAFGIPALGCAIFTATHSRRQQASERHPWGPWLGTLAWCGGGMLVATLPWLLWFGLERGFGTAIYDLYGRIYEEYAVHDITTSVPLRLAGYGRAPAPSAPIAACVALVVMSGMVNVRSPRWWTPRVNSVLLAVGFAIAVLTLSLGGAQRAFHLLREVLLWLTPVGFAVWAVVHSIRNPQGTPWWLAPLVGAAAVLLLDGAPNTDWAHMNFAQGPMLILGIVLLGRLWQGWIVRRAAFRRAVAGGVAGLIALLFLFRGMSLWVEFPGPGWRPVRKTLVWLDLPRGQMWDRAESARVLKANAVFIQNAVPSNGACFEFPGSLNLFLADRRPAGGVAYFHPGFAGPTVDARFGAMLRDAPPPLVIARIDPGGWIFNPNFLATAFPAVTETISERYVEVARNESTHFYVPRGSRGP